MGSEEATENPLSSVDVSAVPPDGTPLGRVLHDATSPSSLDSSPAGSLRGSARGSGGGMKLKQAINNTNLRGSIKLAASFRTLRNMKGDDLIKDGHLRIIKVLGVGAFGSVELCDYNVGGKATKVAVKRLLPELLNKKSDLENFLSECNLLRKIRHSNIVDFIGVGETEHQAVIRTVVAEETEAGTDVFEEEEEKEPVNIFLVQEFCNNGSLQNLLEKNMALGVQSLKVYSVVNALEYAIHIAKGLEYLHLASPMIIHRDLKPDNVLLHVENGKTIAKLADFGLSAKLKSQFKSLSRDSSIKKDQATRSLTRYRSKKQTFVERTESDLLKNAFKLTGETGSKMYMAPEVSRRESYNEKIDIYSLGVILYELFMGYPILCTISHSGQPQEVENYAKRVASGYRVKIPARWPPEVGDVISKMWAQSPEERPSASEAIKLLTGLQPVAEEWHKKATGCWNCFC